MAGSRSPTACSSHRHSARTLQGLSGSCAACRLFGECLRNHSWWGVFRETSGAFWLLLLFFEVRLESAPNMFPKSDSCLTVSCATGCARQPSKQPHKTALGLLSPAGRSKSFESFGCLASICPVPGPGQCEGGAKLHDSKISKNLSLHEHQLGS